MEPTRTFNALIEEFSDGRICLRLYRTVGLDTQYADEEYGPGVPFSHVCWMAMAIVARVEADRPADINRWFAEDASVTPG
jgi:hypothetical protein